MCFMKKKPCECFFGYLMHHNCYISKQYQFHFLRINIHFGVMFWPNKNWCFCALQLLQLYWLDSVFKHQNACFVWPYEFKCFHWPVLFSTFWFSLTVAFKIHSKDFLLFCTNRADGVMRTMSTEKLLKTVPIIQNQMDALLDFNVSLTVCIHQTLLTVVQPLQACKIG